MHPVPQLVVAAQTSSAVRGQLAAGDTRACWDRPLDLISVVSLDFMKAKEESAPHHTTITSDQIQVTSEHRMTSFLFSGNKPR
jgi:hypothetical protein